MVHRTYVGLGRPDRAIEAFDKLAPHARRLYELQAECAHGSADYAAWGVAITGLNTTAYHFTRRQQFYEPLRSEARERVTPGNNRLADRAEARRELEALRPYNNALVELRSRCRPFGPDYLALEIASQGLLTALVHFTGDDRLYAAAPLGRFKE